MNKTLFTISSALIAFSSIVFSAAATAHAQSVTIPLQFSYAGLTFLEPLAYADPQNKPRQQATLSFGIPEKLALTNETTKEVFGEIVLLPTITTAKPLPVLPTQKPPSTVKADNKTTPAPSSKTVLAKAAIVVSPTVVPATPTTTAPVAQTANTGGLDAEKLFAMSNAFRQSRGLPPFQKDERSCSLAASRAPEVAGEVASGNMHAGLRARALPYWNTENIISMRTEEAAFNWWVNDKIHHDAIVGNYTYSCVACSGNNCAQEFTNFQPK